MVVDPLSELRRLVVSDPGVRDRLIDITDEAAFTAEVVELASAHGLAVTAPDVEAGLAAARADWHARWL